MRTCQVSLLCTVANMMTGTGQPDHADIQILPTVLVDRGLDCPKPSHKVSLPEPQEQTFSLTAHDASLLLLINPELVG